MIPHALANISMAHAGAALGLTAVASAVIAGWNSVKSWLSYIKGFLVKTVELDENTTGVVAMHLRSTYKQPPSKSSLIISRYFQVDSDVMVSMVPFEVPHPRGLCIYYGRRGLLVFQLGHNSSNGVLTTMRGLADLRGLVEDSITDARKLAAIDQQAEDKRGNQFQIIKRIGTAGEDQAYGSYRKMGDNLDKANEAGLVSDSPTRGSMSVYDVRIGFDQSFMYDLSRYYKPAEKVSALRGLAYDDEHLKIIDYCEEWYKNAAWYKQHFIPWKTGILLHGPGGTGKSSMARVIGELLGLPVYEYYLNTMRDAEFIDYWDRMQFPCVVLLDDFDTAFHGREPATIHKALSFETVLKQISGISSANGVLLVITTNHLEHIDPALGTVTEDGRPTRPGRIDKVSYFGVTSAAQRRKLVDIILGDWTGSDVESLVAQGDGMTAAQFQALCIEVAYKQLAATR